MRDVPPFEQSRQLAAEAVALLPGGLRAAVQAALPLNQQHALAEVPTCRAAGAGAPAGSGGKGTGSGSSARDLDPWLLLEGGTCDTSAEAAPAPPSAPPGTAAAAAVPPWLEGAVKRRRRGLCYWPAPHAGEGPMLSIEAQLRQRGGYGDAAG